MAIGVARKLRQHIRFKVHVHAIELQYCTRGTDPSDSHHLSYYTHVLKENDDRIAASERTSEPYCLLNNCGFYPCPCHREFSFAVRQWMKCPLGERDCLMVPSNWRFVEVAHDRLQKARS